MTDSLLLHIRVCQDADYLRQLRAQAQHDSPGHEAIRRAVDARLAQLAEQECCPYGF
jgi:hypothetical protein